MTVVGQQVVIGCGSWVWAAFVDGRITWAHIGPFRSYDDLLAGVRARTE